jgi:hypothetical protein
MLAPAEDETAVVPQGPAELGGSEDPVQEPVSAKGRQLGPTADHRDIQAFSS